MNVKLICIGSLKEKFWNDAILEYKKRLMPFCNFDICEITEYKLGKNFSKADIIKSLDEECNKILSNIPKNSYVISLCIEGKSIDSEALANYIYSVGLNGISSIVFIIGSSFGLSEKVKNISDLKLSMSRLTFPHQLARVILTEQIYRSFQIIKGTKYHK